MMNPEELQDYQKEVEKVKSIVGKYFSIYDVKVSPDLMSFYCRTWEQDISQKFESLRLEMKAAHYIPILVQQTGEYIIHVQKKPKVKYRSPRLNLVLLIATIFSTAFAGMMNWSAYEGTPLNLESLAKGSLYFALPLMLILGIHELGHYYVAKRHKVDASLPFFIPLPISFLGTLGAVISMRDPIPNRKALMDIGAAGPICGLVVAIPVAVLGWFLTGAVAQPAPLNVPDSGLLNIEFPLFYHFINYLMPMPGGLALHPTALAGWVGIFVTALNLIPAGQLDGGHIARAALGDKAKYVSYAALFLLIFLGLYYFGWLIIGLLIIFLGARHPPPLNDVTKLSLKRNLVGVAMVFIIIISFVPVPFSPVYPHDDFEFRAANELNRTIEAINVTADLGSFENVTFNVNNTGNTFANISMKTDPSNLQNLNWSFLFISIDGREINGIGEIYIELNSSESTNVALQIYIPSSAGSNHNYSASIEACLLEAPGESSECDVVKKLDLNIRTT